MPVIFVHGVPDTAQVWDKVRSRLARRDVIAIELPGFGTPLPVRLQPTKEGYVDWLLNRLVREAGPIDIVGHDWGALLVLRAVSRQPDVARTWAAGGAPLDPDYGWHRAAKLWQTPGAGERVMESTTPEVALPGCSHWWQLERPDAVANHLEALWAPCRDVARRGHDGRRV